MFGRTVGIAAVCALGASALVLPPGVAPVNDNGEFSALDTIAVDPHSQSITIPCPECAFSTSNARVEDAEEGEDLFWIQSGMQDSLLLDFTVSDDNKVLQLNGRTLYQAGYASMPSGPFFPVQAFPSHATVEDLEAGKTPSTALTITGYQVEVIEHGGRVESDDQLLTVNFGILAINNEEMLLNEVAIKVLQTASENLLILQVEDHPSTISRPSLDDFRGFQPDEEVEAKPWHHGPESHHHEFDGEEDEGRPWHHGPKPDHHGFEGEEIEGRPWHHGPHDGSRMHKNKECKVLPLALCKLRDHLEAKIDQLTSQHGHFRPQGPPCPGAGKADGKGHGRPHGEDHGEDHREMHGEDHRENHGKGHGRPLGENHHESHREGHGKDLPTHKKPHFDQAGKDEDGPRHPHGHHGHPHHPHPHGNHHHRPGQFARHFFRVFAKGLVAFFIPVMAGIAVGTMVSLVGLLVGRLVSLVWIKVFRGGRRGQASIALPESAIHPSEDKSLLAEMESPPVYEDAPAYVDEEKAEKQ